MGEETHGFHRNTVCVDDATWDHLNLQEVLVKRACSRESQEARPWLNRAGSEFTAVPTYAAGP